MGRPKPLLRCGRGGETFLAAVVRTLREAGLDHIVVVVRPTDGCVREAVATLGRGVHVLENPLADRGQLSSLVIAVDHADAAHADGIVVVPVDMPLVRASSVAAAIRAFEHGGAPLVRVTHRGRHGHPVIFAASLFDALRHADPAIGANAVVRAHAGALVDLEVDDPGVLRDVDTTADYRAAFGHDPE